MYRHLSRKLALLIAAFGLSLQAGGAYAGPFDIDISGRVDDLLSKVKIGAFDVKVNWNPNYTASYHFTTTGFTKDQSDKLKRSLDLMYSVLQDPENLSNFGPTTPFQQCVLDNANRYLNPNWLDKKLEERRFVVGIVSGVMVLSSGKNFIKGFTEKAPTGGRDFIRGGFAPVKTVKGGEFIEISMNTVKVDKRTEQKIAQTLFHEILHNAGWTHPTTGIASKDYPGTFIDEAAICLYEQLSSGTVEKSLHGDEDEQAE